MKNRFKHNGMAAAAAAFTLVFAANAQAAEGKAKLGDAEIKARVDLPESERDKNVDARVNLDTDKDRSASVQTDLKTDEDRSVGAAKHNKASGLVGMEVRNHQNEKLGEVSDVVFDLGSGKISYVVLGVGGFLGIGEKLIAVPPSAFATGVDDSYVLLNADKLRIQNAPGFVKTAWPNPTTWRGADYWKEQQEVGGSASVDTGRGTSAESNARVSVSTEAEANRRDSDRKHIETEVRADKADRIDAKDMEIFRGRVTSVNPEQRTITVEGDNGSQTFKVDNQGALQVRNQKISTLHDFKVGQGVTVQYQNKNGERTAYHVMTTSVVESK